MPAPPPQRCATASPRRWRSLWISPPGDARWIGPATHRVGSLSAEGLVASIRALAGEPRFRQGARELQHLLAREDGVTSTVSAIEAHFGRMR